MRRAILLLTTMVVVLVVYAGAALAQPSEKIFFGRWLYKDCPGLCTMNPNGSGSQPIKLHDSASDAAPSPDGSKITYVGVLEDDPADARASGGGRVKGHSSGIAMPWSPSALRGRPSPIA